MSVWRRLALEHVPSCKKVIAGVKDPHWLWLALADEMSSRYGQPPVEAAKIREIYEFARLCSRSNKPKLLTTASWLFFDKMVGAYISGDEHIRKILPELMSSDDFARWLEGMGKYAGKDYSEVKRAFMLAKRHGS